MISHDPSEVILTDKARSKCFRMLSQHQLKFLVKRKCARKKSDGVFVIQSEFKNRYTGNMEEVDILYELTPDGEGGHKAVVITQMHSNH